MDTMQLPAAWLSSLWAVQQPGSGNGTCWDLPVGQTCMRTGMDILTLLLLPSPLPPVTVSCLPALIIPSHFSLPPTHIRVTASHNSFLLSKWNAHTVYSLQWLYQCTATYISYSTQWITNSSLTRKNTHIQRFSEKYCDCTFSNILAREWWMSVSTSVVGKV